MSSTSSSKRKVKAELAKTPRSNIAVVSPVKEYKNSLKKMKQTTMTQIFDESSSSDSDFEKKQRRKSRSRKWPLNL